MTNYVRTRASLQASERSDYTKALLHSAEEERSADTLVDVGRIVKVNVVASGSGERLLGEGEEYSAITALLVENLDMSNDIIVSYGTLIGTLTFATGALSWVTGPPDTIVDSGSGFYAAGVYGQNFIIASGTKGNNNDRDGYSSYWSSQYNSASTITLISNNTVTAQTDDGGATPTLTFYRWAAARIAPGASVLLSSVSPIRPPQFRAETAACYARVSIIGTAA